MSEKERNIDTLTRYLDDNQVAYSIDTNPTKEKIESINQAIERKEALISSSIALYTALVVGRQ